MTHISALSGRRKGLLLSENRRPLSSLARKHRRLVPPVANLPDFESIRGRNQGAPLASPPQRGRGTASRARHRRGRLSALGRAPLWLGDELPPPAYNK